MDKALKERKLLGKLIVQLGVALIAIHVIAVIFRWYHIYQWIDIPQHFFGGILVALTFYWLNFAYPRFLKLIPGALAPSILVLSWTAFLGVLFEFTEFLYDTIIFGYFGIGDFPSQLGLSDTIGDLFLDILGGLSLVIFMRLRYDKRKRQL